MFQFKDNVVWLTLVILNTGWSRGKGIEVKAGERVLVISDIFLGQVTVKLSLQSD